MVKFKKIFGKLHDPRAENAQHELLEILVIAFSAVLCGAKGLRTWRGLDVPRRGSCGCSCR